MPKTKKPAPKSANNAKTATKKDIVKNIAKDNAKNNAKNKLVAKGIAAQAKEKGAKPAAKNTKNVTDKGSEPINKAKLKEAAPIQEKISLRVNEVVVQVKVKKGRKSKASEEKDSDALSQKWTSLYRKTQDVEAQPYNMKNSYEPKTPILHKLLGWGYILNNKNDRLEVLFEDGVRFLISNYKS